MRKIKFIECDPCVELVKNVDGGVQGGIVFDDGTALVDCHYQDCCEQVYADWEYLLDESYVMECDFSDLDIEERTGRHDNGIRICATNGMRFFVPCYNEQNGYYNSNLNIKLVEVETGRVLKEWKEVPVTDKIY